MSIRKAHHLAAAAAALLLSSPAQALLFRAYLSSQGADTNPCTLQAPCRLLPEALLKVADGGEIWMLDSANYNTSQVNIAKSVTILAIPGALGSVISTAGGDAINIATAGVSVALRNLSFAPVAGSGGVNGVVMNDGARLSIEKCVFYNFSAGHGIRVTSPSIVRVTDTLIRDNAFGIWIQGGATADISGTKIMGHSNFGIRVNGNLPGIVSNAAVTDSVLTGNFYGVSVYADNASAVSRASVTRTTFTANTIGVRSESLQGTVQAIVGGSMLTGNGKAFSQAGAGATLETLGTNLIRQNDTADEGTVTGVAPS
jgi:nitrous oxidase accessory protein NosD